MRRAPTDAERKLWQILRDRRFEQYKFRRQFPIGNYIVDFVCLSEKLIIEADGGQHDENRDADLARTRWLELNGYRVLRFWNREILAETEGVYICILRALNPELFA
jgi:very-short-patch-repair endonuclease